MLIQYKLIALIRKAGVDNKELENAIGGTSKLCEIWCRFKRLSLQPVVSITIASKFNVFENEPPALEHCLLKLWRTTCRQWNSSRQEFIRSESGEWLEQAFQHNIQASESRVAIFKVKMHYFKKETTVISGMNQAQWKAIFSEALKYLCVWIHECQLICLSIICKQS